MLGTAENKGGEVSSIQVFEVSQSNKEDNFDGKNKDNLLYNIPKGINIRYKQTQLQDQPQRNKWRFDPLNTTRRATNNRFY